MNVKKATRLADAEILVDARLHDLANELANLTVQLDLLATTTCGACRTGLGEKTELARASVEASLALVQDLKEPPSHRLGPISILERMDGLARSKPELEARYGLSIEVAHHVSTGCRVYSNMAIANEVTRQLLENASRAGAKRVRIHYQEFTDIVEAVYADDGEGMTHAEIEKLGVIEPCDGPSGGLGVQIVRRLVQQANGIVWWSSRKNVGTWVTIHLRKLGRRRPGA